MRLSREGQFLILKYSVKLVTQAAITMITQNTQISSLIEESDPDYFPWQR